jgi:transposase
MVVDQKQIDLILENVKPVLSKEHYQILNQALFSLVWILDFVKEKKSSIQRLSSMIFGKKTESFQNLKKRAEQASQESSPLTDLTKDSPKDSNIIFSENNGAQCEKVFEEQGKDSLADSPKDSNTVKEPPTVPPTPDNLNPTNPKPKPKGHGRKPINDYKITNLTHVFHENLKPGEVCPKCGAGSLYNYDPELLLMIQGQSLLKGLIWNIQKLRCGGCSEIFRAKLPKEAAQPKADFAAKAVVCISKYQLGTPLYRLEAILKLQGLPVSDSELWEWTEDVGVALFPVHQELTKMAAAANVIHHDDTSVKVLDLMEENQIIKQEQEANLQAGKKAKEAPRVGMFSTAILAKTKGRQISIHITGRKNAGENLDDLLDKRPKGLDKPVQACDASSSNKVEKHETHTAKCLNHARHNFCEILESWPKECLTFIELINIVFMNDRETKGMTPEDRQKFHQHHSAPVMSKIQDYGNKLIKDKVVEPNSSLGKAIAYLNSHWEGLTLFLKNGSAPLSNNDVERIIKSFVLIRKNSYFYKSLWGALIGDVLLSTINTCRLNDVNSEEYLIAIQANAKQVNQNPEKWLPWNYKQNTACPHVNSGSKGTETIYQPPIDTVLSNETGSRLSPILQDSSKKSIREKCKNFFRYFCAKKMGSRKKNRN